MPALPAPRLWSGRGWHSPAEAIIVLLFSNSFPAGNIAIAALQTFYARKKYC
jgi:hypothetical protein